MKTFDEITEAQASECTSGAFSVSLPLTGYARAQAPQDPNGLHAWAAWAEARSSGADLPAWVAAYFDRAAAGILRCLENYNDRSSRKRIAKRVFNALELSGRRPGHRGNAFEDLTRREWRRDIGRRVAEKVRAGMSLDAAAVEFAPVSATAVKGAYRWWVEQQPRP